MLYIYHYVYFFFKFLFITLLLYWLYIPTTYSQECIDWKNHHSEWIFCDDFETQDSLIGPGRYFEASDNIEIFAVIDGVGINQSRGIRIRWQKDQVAAGGLKLSFARNPQAYMDKNVRNKEDFREIYYRMYLKMQSGWQGSPDKLSRVTIFNNSEDWSQAMIAHLWSGRNGELLMDPVRCVNADNKVKCNGYNDFTNMSWLGITRGQTKIFITENSGKWFCVEHHVRLNDPGQANGLQEFWINNKLEAVASRLDFVRSWTEYGLNAIFFENYWNKGSIRDQERYFDNIVVSTKRIGCL